MGFAVAEHLFPVVLPPIRPPVSPSGFLDDMVVESTVPRWRLFAHLYYLSCRLALFRSHFACEYAARRTAVAACEQPHQLPATLCHPRCPRPHTSDLMFASPPVCETCPLVAAAPIYPDNFAGQTGTLYNYYVLFSFHDDASGSFSSAA